MTIEEIRKNAPDGATHYDTTDLDYLKLCNKEWYWWCDSKWYQAMISDCYYNANIKPL